jgi:hypothetical protein
MKRLVALLILFLAALLPSARAQQGPDDQYIIIYTLMQQADSLDSSGQPRQALAQYVQVQGELQKFQKIYPDWNPRIVSFRLNYLAEKIAEVTAKLPVAPPSGAPPPASPAPGAAPPSTSNADLEAQLGALHEQMQKLQADNTTLQAKLQEALAAQPAAIDSRELTRARETIRSLMKENDLLKVSLAQGKTGEAAGGAGAESDALKLAQAALAEANQALAEQTARAGKLALENQALQSRVQALLAGPEAMAALREENALLKKQLADLKPAATNLAEAAQLNAELDGARKQIAVLQSAAEVGFLERAALENRVRQLQIAAVNSAPAAPPPNQAENEARIRALTQERNDLLAKLGEANQELYGRRKQDAVARINVLTWPPCGRGWRWSKRRSSLTRRRNWLCSRSPRRNWPAPTRRKNPSRNCPAARPNWWPRRSIIFWPNNTTRPRMIIKKSCSATKTTDWCWPTWQRLKWSRASWRTRKSTSPPPSLKVRTTPTTFRFWAT